MPNIVIAAVIASPHRSGSTSHAVEAVLEGARRVGAGTESVDLAAEGPEAAADLIDRAQGIVLASPVYRASHTSLLAGLLEHIERGASGEPRAPLRGKAVAIVQTGASHHHFLAPERLRATLASFFAAQVLSPSLYFTPDAYTAEKALDAASRELAELHGQALAELTAGVHAGAALSRLAPLI